MAPQVKKKINPDLDEGSEEGEMKIKKVRNRTPLSPRLHMQTLKWMNLINHLPMMEKFLILKMKKK